MYETIVVGTDGSETATVAVERAAALAAASGARLVIVSAYRPIPEVELKETRQEVPDDLSWVVTPRQVVDSVLAEAASTASAAGVAKVETKAVLDAPAEAVIDTARGVDADLIVVGSVGMTGAKRFLIGSVPNRVTHHAHCDVLVVRTAP